MFFFYSGKFRINIILPFLNISKYSVVICNSCWLIFVNMNIILKKFYRFSLTLPKKGRWPKITFAPSSLGVFFNNIQYDSYKESTVMSFKQLYILSKSRLPRLSKLELRQKCKKYSEELLGYMEITWFGKLFRFQRVFDSSIDHFELRRDSFRSSNTPASFASFALVKSYPLVHDWYKCLHCMILLEYDMINRNIY